MKKFLIPVLALAFSSAVFASDVAPVVAAPEVAPVVDISKADTSKIGTSKEDVAQKAEAGFFAKYFSTPTSNVETYLRETIVANPWRSVFAVAVVTVATMKAIEYAQAANSDEDAQF